MLYRTLRSRTIEITKTAEESGSDWPCDQPEVLGNVDEDVQGTHTALGQHNTIEEGGILQKKTKRPTPLTSIASLQKW
jgi:hypothetical protein